MFVRQKNLVLKNTCSVWIFSVETPPPFWLMHYLYSTYKVFMSVNCLSDLWFVVLWLGEEDKRYDTISSRDISPQEGGDVLHVQERMVCKAAF